MFSALMRITVMCLEQQISRMISEGSCDTEDLSNDVKKKLDFKIYSNRKALLW